MPASSSLFLWQPSVHVSQFSRLDYWFTIWTKSWNCSNSHLPAHRNAQRDFRFLHHFVSIKTDAMFNTCHHNPFAFHNSSCYLLWQQHCHTTLFDWCWSLTSGKCLLLVVLLHWQMRLVDFQFYVCSLHDGTAGAIANRWQSHWVRWIVWLRSEKSLNRIESDR